MEAKQLNIYERMSLITDEIGTVAKNLKVQVTKVSSYNAVSERDILDSVKPIEKKYRVYSYPYEREIVDSDTLVKKNDYGETSSLYLRIKTIYRFINVDNPTEYLDITSYADGIDTGDKATGKAMTYADKYALMKAYKISTGEDPDKDASPETGYHKEERKASPKQIELISKLVADEDKLCEYYKIDRIEDLTVAQASEIIAKKRGK